MIQHRVSEETSKKMKVTRSELQLKIFFGFAFSFDVYTYELQTLF